VALAKTKDIREEKGGILLEPIAIHRAQHKGRFKKGRVGKLDGRLCPTVENNDGPFNQRKGKWESSSSPDLAI